MSSIAKTILAFLNLFSNIPYSRIRSNGQVQQYTIPIFFTPREKFIQFLDNPGYYIPDYNNSTNKITYDIMLPVITVELTSIQYDSTRKRGQLNQLMNIQIPQYTPSTITTSSGASGNNIFYSSGSIIGSSGTSGILSGYNSQSLPEVYNTPTILTQFSSSGSSNSYSFQYIPVPYNLSFKLNIMSKMIYDILNIIEYILPYFQPSYSQNVFLNEFLGSFSISTILKNVGLTFQNEMQATDDRVLYSELEFEVQTWVFFPQKTYVNGYPIYTIQNHIFQNSSESLLGGFILNATNINNVVNYFIQYN